MSDTVKALRLLLSFAVLLIGSACSPRGMSLANVGYGLPEPSQPDPERYFTYTLFLATSEAQNNPEYDRLRSLFRIFAAQVAAKNRAIWVSEEKIPGLSVSKGKVMFERYQIAYSRELRQAAGPFVIVSELHPDDWPGTPSGRNERGLPVAISFHKRTPDGIGKVFDCLRDCVSQEQGTAESRSREKVSHCGRCGIVITVTAEADGPR